MHGRTRSRDVAGTVSDLEQVDHSAAQVGQSLRGEDVSGTGSNPGSSQIPRSVRLRAHKLTPASLPREAVFGGEDKVIPANCISTPRQCLNMRECPSRNFGGDFSACIAIHRMSQRSETKCISMYRHTQNGCRLHWLAPDDPWNVNHNDMIAASKLLKLES